MVGPGPSRRTSRRRWRRALPASRCSSCWRTGTPSPARRTRRTTRGRAPPSTSTMAEPSAGLTLDTGALIAIERGHHRLLATLELALRRGSELHVVPGVLAQAWHGGPRQARLARFLASPEVTVTGFDETTARLV